MLLNWYFVFFYCLIWIRHILDVYTNLIVSYLKEFYWFINRQIIWKNTYWVYMWKNDQLGKNKDNNGNPNSCAEKQMFVNVSHRPWSLPFVAEYLLLFSLRQLILCPPPCQKGQFQFLDGPCSRDVIYLQQ